MEIEQGKGGALMTAQRYNYSYSMDARDGSAKLKAPWREACTCNAPLYAANEVKLNVSSFQG